MTLKGGQVTRSAGHHRPSDLTAHQVIRSSQVINSSNRQVIISSGHQVPKSSNRQVIRSSGHQVIKHSPRRRPYSRAPSR
eukprot:6907869-Prymnesium_polylepis.1